MNQKPTRKFVIELLPYLAGNPQTGYELVDPKQVHFAEGTTLYVEGGQFYVKDVHGSCVFTAPVDSVRYCNVVRNGRVKKILKVLTNGGDVVK